MSGFGLTLTWDDLQVRAAMDRLGALGRDLREEVMNPIGLALEASTVDRFYSSVGPDGEAWEPSLRASITGGRTLVETGQLRDSIHFRAEAEAVEVGTADVRAGVHQFGAVIHAKTGGGLHFTLADGLRVTVDTVTIPERPFVGLSEQDGRIVVGIAEGAMRHAVAGGAA